MAVKDAVGRTITVAPLGDRALAVVIEGAAWRELAAAAQRLRECGAVWIVDVVPAYDSITVVYDPLALLDSAGRRSLVHFAAGLAEPFELAQSELVRLLAAGGDSNTDSSRLIEIPVWYGGEYGPDLQEAAARAGMNENEFIRRHAAAEYTVVMIGFLPGFPYLRGLPPELAQPRKPSPRSRVPAGSVGIAGGQTGIYPFATPGGWQLIGRTPAVLFDPRREEPSLLRAGDRLRFVPAE